MGAPNVMVPAVPLLSPKTAIVLPFVLAVSVVPLLQSVLEVSQVPEPSVGDVGLPPLASQVNGVAEAALGLIKMKTNTRVTRRRVTEHIRLEKEGFRDMGM